MLKLSQLEISGFKSFVEPTTVSFSGSINAIVGPNGCGKSNLADAITWVLGEQSAKTLRGGKMEDVIFGGSEKRRPLGMAEVTLSLQSQDPSKGQDGRITIGRRVFRSGESRYTLNGKTVRLRDIKDLLMDTGLGIRTYSVIEQGKIDLILSGKPQERRRLLEEAAGVTRYKARRRLAEIKLEEATANLLRLDDILAEVERALRSLKRQASAARRFQHREGEYKELLERVLLARAGLLSSSLTEKRQAIQSFTDQETALTTQLSSDEAGLAEAREHVDRLSGELAERHQRDADLAATIEGRQEFLRHARVTREEIAKRLASGDALHERQVGELELFEAERQRLETKRVELLSLHAEAESSVANDRDDMAEAERGVRDAEDSKRSTRDEVVETASRLSLLRSRLQEVGLENEKSRYRQTHLEADLEQKTRDLAESEKALADSEKRQTDLGKRVGELEERSATLDRDLQQVLEHEAKGVGEKRQLEDLLAADRQRRILLEEISDAEREQRSDLVAGLQGAGLPVVEFLGDRLQAPEGWESSLDEFLGDLSDAAVLPAEIEASSVAARLVEARRGAALLTPDRGDPACDPDIEDPAIVSSLGEALGLPASLAKALPPAFLVDDIEDAVRLARLHPGIAFLSRRGPWARAGILRSEGSSPQPGLLARASELVEIADRQEARKIRLTEIESELAQWVARRTQLAARGRQLQEELAQSRQQLAVTRARQEDLGQRHARIDADIKFLVKERDQIVAVIAETGAEIEKSRAELGLTETHHQQLELAFETANQSVDLARSERESLRTDAASRRGQLELVSERLRSHDQHLQRVSREIESNRGQIESWLTEKETQLHRREQLELDAVRSGEELQVALEKRAASQEAVLAHQEQLDRRKEGIRKLELGVGENRKSKESMQGQLEALRVEAATLRQEEAHLGALFAEQLRRALPENLGTIDEDELAELEADLATQKDALDRVGPVNVLAAQEYGEQEERHAFLTEQRADVSQSVESLKSTIKEINETSSVRFKATFEEVNRSFGEVFAKLFRGGEAEMRLLDEDDILESGIEIVARPPGKRLQNMMLLSGGEKALSALALLFALFHTKPTPFCILDEVDAPLDDVNTLRFIELLEGMASKVQFLIITHNKLTMESASSLYGVTMQERGVSKLVSVELDKVQPGDAPN